MATSFAYFWLHWLGGMYHKDLISKICIMLWVSGIVVTVASGCSDNAQKKERAAVTKHNTETRKIPRVTEQEIRYSEDTGKINKLAHKLKANPTPETSKEIEAEIKKPSIFIRDYLQENSGAPEGAAALALIASTYRIVETQIGNQKEQITKTYKLIIRLYPDSPEASDANDWLDKH